MGLDLYLLPVEFDSEVLIYSHTILNCEREIDWFHQIFDIKSFEGSEIFRSYFSYSEKLNQYGYGVMLDDAYGDRLKYCYAKDLIKIRPEYQKNKAAINYLKILDPKTKVYLYWH